MDLSFTPEQEMLRESARKLMERVATPDYVRRLDRERQYPDELYDAWVEAGFLGASLPEEYGGIGGSLIDVAIITEELARVSADLMMPYGGSMFCALNVLRNGSEQLKRKWLPKLISGEVKFSIGLSEPDAGSDLAAIRTSARRDGDHYVINGMKTWQTGAGAKRNVINLYVRTDPAADYRKGMSLILVPNDAPGVELRKLDMLGRYCTGTYQVTFNDVRVPVDNLVGRENEGWKCLLSGLTAERSVVAAGDVGSASAVVDMTVAYAQERKQFGRPIGTNQALAHMIADLQTEVEAARALMWRAVWLAETNGPDALRDITMAKLFASEIYVKACNVGMQVFGGNGYSMEYDIQRHYRDCRMGTVAAGSSQMLRNLIAGLSGLRVQ
jgi:alkylation response protein AidB-like acyl-CoA dehydrogenase